MPLINMLLVLGVKCKMHRTSSVLHVAIVLLQRRATTAKPKVRTLVLLAKSAVVSAAGALGFELEFIAKRCENGFVEVSHFGVVVTAGECEVAETHGYGDGDSSSGELVNDERD